MKYNIEPELILIPAGEFLMGSDPEQDQDAYEDEQPQHRVYLPDYYIARTPTTNAQYAAFVNTTRRHVPRHWYIGKPPRGEKDHPVVNVSWYDALAYCRWLSEATGKPYTLPSEAEWEKAASWETRRGGGKARGRGGDIGVGRKRVWPWGNVFDKRKCNTSESGIEKTTPVGTYSPEGDSAYGCADIAGNMWEWTRSLYQPYPYVAEDGRENLEAGEDMSRVLRGGSFLDDQGLARCACRINLAPYFLFSYWGFRVVCPSDNLNFRNGALA